MTPLDALVTALLGGFVCLVVGNYLISQLFRCPDCGMRSDYDHIAVIDDSAPFCPYCGTRTVYIGRKIDAYRSRLRGEQLSPKRAAGYQEVEDDG